MEVPNISVIIPLYNAKEYIGKCLDSLLAQTFQNFEVIVVNDCSTDKSADIVESFKEKFGERLKLTNTEKNSGGCGFVPRNVGLGLASGEYVFFVDADDYLAENALTILYTAAKENEAEVVYTTAYYNLSGSEEFKILRDANSKNALKKSVDGKTVLTVDEFDKNINRLFSGENFHTAWTKFVQRDFLLKNKILFPEITTGGDYIWSMNIFCHASKVLHLFVPVYFRRSYSPGLVERKALRPSSKIYFWVSAFVVWLKALNRLANKNEILRKDSAQYYRVSSDYFKYCLEQISDEVLNRFYSKDTHEILFREFLKRKDSSYLTVPFLFSAIANREKNINKNQKQLDQLAIDVDRQQKKINSMESHLRPLVSIIIPMYNAEKFIGEALDSLLAQTLENFEVLVVDDCSKDNSYKVVEKYIPKFNGRLKLLKMAKNSGAAPAPRNKGFLFSHGDYIFFMDSDDFLTKTALEEMYTLAKNYKADVVYCEKYYMSTGFGEDFVKNIHLADKLIQHKPFVDKPTFISENFADRLRELSDRKFWVTPWQRLVKREVITENQIVFPRIIGSDDVVWCFQVLFCAKRFLRVPNACYIRRMSEESFTQSSKKSPNRHIRQWGDITIRGLKFVNDFMDKVKFFCDNPSYRYEAFRILARATFSPIAPICENLQAKEIYDIFLTEFAKDTGENSVLVSFLCTRVCDQDKNFKKKQQELNRANDTIKETQYRIAKLEDEKKTAEKEIKRLKDAEQEYQSRIADLEGIIRRLQNTDEENSNLPATFESSKFSRPAISVIIPMYNAEEFIGECLDSLLMQTFQDFEVIVADDCSTDESLKIVESYAPKFDGRLQITQTNKNSGGGGYVPRNLGFNLARGEYVFFADADDFLLATALDTLYTLAKEYAVDIVYTSAHYQLDKPNDVFVLRDGKGKKLLKGGIEDRLIVNEEPEKNLQMLIFDRGFTTPWSKLIRRDFLIKNEITFPEIAKAGDHIWTINLYCHAKSVLRLPVPLYFYRKYNTGSISRIKRSTSEQVSYWVSSFVEWLKTLHKLANKTDILKENPAYCYEASKRDFEWLSKCLTEELNKSTNEDIYDILYREFGKGNDLSDFAVPFLFTAIDTEKKNREDKSHTINKLKKEIEQLKKSKK